VYVCIYVCMYVIFMYVCNVPPEINIFLKISRLISVFRKDKYM
jgi:hypothetical protein